MTAGQNIPGAPDWVQEFLQRVDLIIAVHESKESEGHVSVLAAVNELSGTVGQIAGALSRLDRKVEYLRGEMRNTRDEVSQQGARLLHLEEEMHSVRDQMDKLEHRSQELETEIHKFRTEVGDAHSSNKTTA